MDAFEKWKPADGYGQSTLDEIAEQAFRAGMRAAAEIARRYEPDERANYVTYASNDILAEADK